MPGIALHNAANLRRCATEKSAEEETDEGGIGEREGRKRGVRSGHKKRQAANASTPLKWPLTNVTAHQHCDPSLLSYGI